MIKRATGLRARVTLWLVLYAALLSLAVFVHGFIVNEQAEQLTWRSLLRSELDHFVQRSEEDPDYRWIDTDTVQLFGDDDASPPPDAFATFKPGIHDGIQYQGRDHVLLVEDVNGRRLILALDITELQAHENKLGLWMLTSNLVAIGLLGILVAWGLGRVVEPLSRMAERIHALRPDKPGQHLELDTNASREQVVISEALNDYLQRNDRFVERERAFINSTSHELRTPIAVINGATEVALEQDGIPPAVRQQLLRIRQTTDSVEELITLLLVLAKDPARLAKGSDYVRLDQLIPGIVADHQHLSAHKDLELHIDELARCELFVPVAVMQVAIGNLLRNAIENSDRGVVRVSLQAPASIRIEDPGHGMTPEEVSAIYARMARGDSSHASGIGLALIARLCDHLGWKLTFTPGSPQGTVATLDLQGALASSGGATPPY